MRRPLKAQTGWSFERPPRPLLLNKAGFAASFEVASTPPVPGREFARLRLLDGEPEIARFSHDFLIDCLENIYLKWMLDHVACEVCDNCAYLDGVRPGSPRRLRSEEPSGLLAVDLNGSIDEISGGIDDDELPLEEGVIHGFGE